MTKTNTPLPHATTENGNGPSVRTDRQSAWARRAQLIYDAVIAAYIHDISAHGQTAQVTYQAEPAPAGS